MTKPWEAYEATIKDLYAENTLSVVRQIMIDRYGFKASVRAYRGRLIRWGVRKYNCRKRASPSTSHSSTDDGSSFTSGSDTASPIMTAAATATTTITTTIGDARAILPRTAMKQGDSSDGHLAMPLRMNQQYNPSHIFSVDTSFNSKPNKAFMLAPQANNGNNSGGGGGGSSSSNNGLQFEWETTTSAAPFLKKDPDAAAADLDNYDGLPPPLSPSSSSSYFGGLTASIIQSPGNRNGSNRLSYGTGGYEGPASTLSHQHHQHQYQHRNTNGAGDGLTYYNSPGHHHHQQQQQQQQQVYNSSSSSSSGAVVGVNQVPSDMSFVAGPTRGYSHEGLVHR
ncbi:uncharacterized protein F4812DRAFT_409743 [Daldinia caldariorum]|uniref:uncharacterized protein n=1 Tax=Daldinia caldariorum TaxID=326644 RepID=UPI002008A5D1|nr:uncharacterized protein F4812DRAFT_409743 [Daldinia caldariorum]KAI1472638.1 hypothetical protein F4812DRAFT_409743 [Daldinia caldariorum]